MTLLGILLVVIGSFLLLITSCLLILTIGLREIIRKEISTLVENFLELEASIHTVHLMMDEMDRVNLNRDKNFEKMEIQMQSFANDVHLHISELSRKHHSLN